MFVGMVLNEGYSYFSNSSLMDFEFESIGPKGAITKVARFSKIGENLFNFGFGDLDKITGEIYDNVKSNNGDDEKILLTVANIIYDFTEVYYNAAVFIKGTTPSRTRRYQMGINKFWSQIFPIFKIYGLKEENWEEFQHGENYVAFLGLRKGSFLINL